MLSHSRIFVLLALLQTGLLDASPAIAKDSRVSADIIVYGGTSAAIVAAIEAKHSGKSVIMISPDQHLGGLTSGGLGATDIGNKGAIGGLSREFYRRVWKFYSKPQAWRENSREELKLGIDNPSQSQWVFEPHVAELIFEEWLAEAEVKVVRKCRLKRPGGVIMDGDAIASIQTEDGQKYAARMFIDATYEGDLMAEAGVSYTFGREASDVYNEPFNGVATRLQKHAHRFIKPVDPYIILGNADSGLLPGIDTSGPGVEGSGDKKIQAYCFRMCLTDSPSNRIPFPKPKNYNENEFELLFRNFEAGDHQLLCDFREMPNRKTDSNNFHAVSTDYIGMNYDYPDADYETRDRIIEAHRDYQMGLMWTLANHPRTPESIRKVYGERWGLAEDEFRDSENWPHQLYIRESRRMISDYVMIQSNCENQRVAERAVGLAAYTMDSHNVQRYVTAEGFVQNEGDVQEGGFPPYPIDYLSIVPKRSECGNLLVPVCLSASHIAFGSIRMEPVFMVLGQSSAAAACIAMDRDLPVQEISYQELRRILVDRSQVLEWRSPN